MDDRPRILVVPGVGNAQPADEHSRTIMPGEIRRPSPHATWSAVGNAHLVRLAGDALGRHACHLATPAEARARLALEEAA
ncbi:MAG: hypothetical protein ACJ8AI_17430 [Rhodopila sp.]